MYQEFLDYSTNMGKLIFVVVLSVYKEQTGLRVGLMLKKNYCFCLLVSFFLLTCKSRAGFIFYLAFLASNLVPGMLWVLGQSNPFPHAFIFIRINNKMVSLSDKGRDRVEDLQNPEFTTYSYVTFRSSFIHQMLTERGQR